jgi:hypothetical protein
MAKGRDSDPRHPRECGRENAAVLAVMGIPELRDETAQAYVQDYPDRRPALEELLAVLKTSEDQTTHHRMALWGQMRKSSPSRHFPVTVTHLPITRCDVCHGTVAYRPGTISEALTEHYRRAHPETLDLTSR